MATMATTPVRNRGSELSNESPLPTPPKAMHDFMARTSRNAGRTSGPRSSIGDRRRDDDDNADAGVHHVTTYARQTPAPRNPSSPSERAAFAASRDGEGAVARKPGQRSSAEKASSRPTYHDNSPAPDASGSRPASSLATSFGASAARQGQRNALGAQLGIRSDAEYDLETGSERPTSSRRPSLGDRGRRTASYESSGSAGGSTGKQERSIPSPLYAASREVREDAEVSPRYYSNGDGDKENAHHEYVPYKSSARRRNGEVIAVSDRLQETTAQVNAGPALSNSRPKDLVRRTSAEAYPSHNNMEEAASQRNGISQHHSTAKGNRSPQQISSASHGSTAEPNASRPSFQTPSMSAAARGLRSGHSARMNAAPWSVGRSIKRIDRHIAPDKPPQRIAAQEVEVEDDEEEEAATFLPVVSEHEGVEEEDAVRPSPLGMPTSSTSQRRMQTHAQHFAGSRQAVHVPLGADEEEDEDEGISGRSARNGPSSSSEAAVAAQQRRRAAMNDIMSAKLPPGANGIRRAVPPLQNGHSIDEQLQQAARWPSSASSTAQAEDCAVSTNADFMALVRREAAQQKGQPFIEQVLAKPSKDLETKFNGFKFKKVRKAGEGGFSTVWVVKGPSAIPDASQPTGYTDVPETEQALFAMKQVTLKKMEKVSRDEVVEECHVLQSLAAKPDNEDYILRFFGWKSSTGSLKILIELGEHDFNHILRSQRLSRTQIVTYWYQMLQAVHFTHEEGNIVHTDLKPANFLMANGRLKLIDFGIAQKIPVGTIHIKRDAMIGTPNYMAPETVRAVKEAATGGRPNTNGNLTNGQADPKMVRVYKAGKASDVWALGCILYQMVYCRPPFEGYHGDDKLREILNPKHRIDFAETRYGPSRTMTQSRDSSPGSQEPQEEDEGVLESVDADLLDAMRLTLTYSASERVTIPQLFEHPLLRPLEEQRRADLRRRNAQSDLEDSHNGTTDDDETVRMTRAELKDILRKMYAYARNGELRDDNLDARSDALFDNVRKRQAQLA